LLNCTFRPDEDDDSVEESTERTADDDEDTEEDQPLEDQLFAGLRRKIENNIKRVKQFVEEPEVVRDAQTEDDGEEPQLPQKRPKRRKQKESRVKVEPTTQVNKCAEHCH
ncbi:hypothetical protein COOONC_00886, partial [Cooperia oncophora]